MEPVLEVRNLNSYYIENRSVFGGKGKRKALDTYCISLSH